MESIVAKKPPSRAPIFQPSTLASNIISIISSDDEEIGILPNANNYPDESMSEDDIIIQHKDVCSSPLKRTSAALYSSDNEDPDPLFSTGLSQPLRKQALFDEFSDDDDDDIEKLVHARRKDYGSLMGISIDNMSDDGVMPPTRNGSNSTKVINTFYT